MATGAQVAEHLADVMDVLPATVFRFCRMLREAGGDLWPEGGKGGGRAGAHVDRKHLTNLAIALAVNDPLHAAEWIPLYRGLLSYRPQAHKMREDSGVAAGVLAANDLFNGMRCLGDELDRLLDVLPNGGVARELENAGLYIEFCLERRIPRAYVGHHVFDPPDDLTKPVIRWIYGRPDNSKSNFLSPRLITRTAAFPVSLFTVMAEQWSDTQRHHARIARRAKRAALVEE
jgi:hypothetical protein